MTNEKQYKRLTNKNRDEYDPEYDFCLGCEYFGEPNGCNRFNGVCANYERFMETYGRLEELEDKIENGTLKELPENAVVLTREEYNDRLIIKEEMLEIRESMASRKKAKEIFSKVINVLEELKARIMGTYGVSKSVCADICIRAVKALAKQYGVEEEE